MSSQNLPFFQLSFLGTRNNSGTLLLQSVRVGLYFLVLLVAVGAYLLQPAFINWSFLKNFYIFLLFGFALQFAWISICDQLLKKSNLYFVGFLIDSVLLSALIHFTGLNQSLFLFLHLVNILVAGLLFQSSGALVVALVTSISYSVATVFLPEVQPMQLVFMLALNNVAFLAVAYLAGYLSEQLTGLGADLVQTGLSLKDQQLLNQTILENLPLGMISFTRSGKVIQVNQAVEKILEKPLQDLDNLAGLSIYKELMSAHSERDRTYVLPSGEKKILQISHSDIFSPVVNDNVTIALIEDLTELRQLEETLKQSEKMAAVGGLAAGIAHEIRNPLAGISGSIELLSQTTTNSDDQKLMKIILREIDRLNNLVGEFLEYSRPETPPTDEVDLVSLLSEVLDNLKLNKNLRPDINLKASLSGKVLILGKRDKLKQAFLNIILNSFQALQEVSNPEFELQIILKNSRVQVLIRDTGCGMSPETKKRMFEPFHTTKPKGTGLGLAVTHKILDGHKAQLFVESEVGKGTEFVITFPLVQNNK